jgi:hypothetical protein
MSMLIFCFVNVGRNEIVYDRVRVRITAVKCNVLESRIISNNTDVFMYFYRWGFQLPYHRDSHLFSLPPSAQCYNKTPFAEQHSHRITSAYCLYRIRGDKMLFSDTYYILPALG